MLRREPETEAEAEPEPEPEPEAETEAEAEAMPVTGRTSASFTLDVCAAAGTKAAAATRPLATPTTASQRIEVNQRVNQRVEKQACMAWLSFDEVVVRRVQRGQLEGAAYLLQPLRRRRAEGRPALCTAARQPKLICVNSDGAGDIVPLAPKAAQPLAQLAEPKHSAGHRNTHPPLVGRKRGRAEREVEEAEVNHRRLQQRVNDAQLVGGYHAGENCAPVSAPVSVSAGASSRESTIAQISGNARRGARRVTGDHDDANAGASGFANRRCRLFSRRVGHAGLVSVERG